MSVQMFELDDVGSVVSVVAPYRRPRQHHATSEASSCPPVPLPRRAKMKKASAPPPPATKVTTPLSQSASTNQDTFHSGSSSGPPPPLSSCDSSGPLSMGPQQHVSDDCAINELLEGRMDLEVFLPDGREVRMNVERRTPMMDLLVQVTTTNKISPGGHVIHILTDRGKDFIHYKPSTPIGSLDTNCVYIVPKSSIIDPPVKKMPKVINKPFEQTFRLQVNLPRSQLMVHRVSPRTTLSDIKKLTCQDKNLDGSRYQLVHPQFPNQILDLNSTLSNYGCNEISLMSLTNINANIRNSTSDLIAYASREEDKKKKGILGIFTRKKSKGSVVDSSSDSMDSRGVSPTRSDGSGNQRAKISVKKRPAPPPPPLFKTEAQPSSGSKPYEDPNAEAIEAGSTVSHSRHSSDSSGYHEASLLSESPDAGAQDVCSGSGSSGLSTDSAVNIVKSSRKTSSPVKPTQLKPKLSSAVSETSLLTTAAKKRRAPPPPPSPSKSEAAVITALSSTSSNEISISEQTTVEVLPEPRHPSRRSPKLSRSTPDFAVSAMKAEISVVAELPPQSKPIETSEMTVNASFKSVPKEAQPSPLETNSLSVESSVPSSPVLDSGIGLDSDDHVEEDRGEDLDMDKEAMFLFNKGGHDENLDDNWFSVGECSTPVDTADTSETPVEPKTNSETSQNLHVEEENDDKFVETLPISPPVRPSRLRSLTSGTLHDSNENNLLSETFVRQLSLTSVRTIDDVQHSFDLTIAEAQKVIDQEEHERRLSHSEASLEQSSSSTSKRDLVVSQQQILSHIEAAFSAVEEQANENMPQSQEAPCDDDLGWEYTIPEPPPAFRNDDDDDGDAEEKLPSISLPPSVVPSVGDPRSSISSTSSDGPPPPLPSLPPPPPVSNDDNHARDDTTEEAIDEEAFREYASLESHFTAPKLRRPPLLNFTIGSYKKSEDDIYGELNSCNSLQSVPEFSELKSLPVYKTSSKDVGKLDVNKKLYVLEGSVRGVRGQVKQICAEIADNGASPALIGRSASMLSLAPVRKVNSIAVVTKPKPVQRANSTVDNIRKAQSVQDLNGAEDEDVSTLDLEQEQARLQEEYTKLHQQFVIWNQQLQDNQHVLEKQKIVPSSSLPPFNGVESVVETSTIVESNDLVKSQTLPRQKSKYTMEVSLREKTSTLERPQRPKSQALANVTIGSWQQRKPIENGSQPNLSKTPFQSVENINRVANTNGTVTDEKQNGYHQSQTKPKPSVQLGSWMKNGTASTSAQEEIDSSIQSKPKIDVQISNFSIQSQQPVSLRSSSTKTNFKPPEVRQSSASRQRLPPEDLVNGNGYVNGTEDSNIPGHLRNGHVTRTSSSAFQKFVFGNESESQSNNNSKTVTYLNGPKESVNGSIKGQTKTIQVNGKIPAVVNGFKPSFTVKTTTPKVIGFKPATVETVSSTTTNGVSVNVTPMQKSSNGFPPPPPPQPQVPIKISKPLGKTVTSASLKVNSNAKRSSRPPVVQLDPREELMLEIRNFGGRTSLRKVSVSQTNWQLKIHGANSSITA